MNEKDYPLVMGVDEVMEILNIGKINAYEIMNSKDFPLIQIGRSKRVKRKDFFDWLERKKVSS